MIMENLEAAQHIIFLNQQLHGLKQASDYYEFAKVIFEEVFVKYAQLCTFIFSVKTENSQGMYEQIAKPSIEAIWSGIPGYDLIKDI